MSTPARTFLLYRASTLAHLQWLRSKTGSRTILGIAVCLGTLAAGCNVTKGGLSGDLPPGGGGGLMTFASVAMPDGVAGRAYSKVVVTSVQPQSVTHFSISPSIASGTAPVASCSLTAGALPAGMNTAIPVDSTGSGCVISGTPSSTSAGTYNFTLQALDSNSPPRAASQSFTIIIRPEFTISAPPAESGTTFVPGVQGRSYGELSNTATAISTTLGTAGNAPIANGGCHLTFQQTNPGFSLNPSANNSCLLTAASVSASGTFTLSASVTDTPITDSETNLPAVPANTVTLPALTNATLPVNAPMKLTAPTGLAAGVDQRAFGSGNTCGSGGGTACVPASFAVSGGLGGYSANATVTGAPGVWQCPLNGLSYTCFTSSVSVAGPYPATPSLNISASDTANVATPAATTTSDPLSAGTVSLTVDAPFTLTAPASAASAVTGRSYGQASTGCSPDPACAAIPYTVSGGLGPYSTSATVVSAPGTWQCPLSGATYDCSSASVSSAGPFPATPSLSLTATDGANASTPAGTSNTATFDLTVNGPLTITPPGSPAAAVNGRPYGANAGVPNPAVCGTLGNSACAPAAFSVSGGLGSYSANATIVSAPGTWQCPLSGTNYDCATPAVSAAGPFPEAASLSLSTSDTANASTQSGTSSTATATLTVGGPLVLAVPGPLSTAVNLRGYGSNSTVVNNTCGPSQNATCLAAIFPISGGLGVYAANPSSVTAPGTWQCPLTGSGYNCATTSVSTPGPFPAAPTLSLTASDVANASTPAAPSNPASIVLPVNAAMTLTPPGSAPDAVTGRPYGEAVAGCSPNPTCAAIKYTITGGLEQYQAGTATLGTSDSLACSVSGTVYSCATAKIQGSSGAALHMVAPEIGNGSTPSGTATDSTVSVTIQPGITVTPVLTSPWPTAVQGRSYGQSGTTADFDATGGIPPYVSYTPVSFPSGFTCAPSGGNGTPGTCSASSVGGASITPYTPEVTVVDTGDASTPAATAVTDPGSTSPNTTSLTVNQPLTINSITLPNALLNYPYPTSPSVATLTVAGGLGGDTWVAPGGTGSCATAPSGNLPTGLALDPNSGELSGTPTAASASDTDFTFSACATDTANSMTPAGSFTTSNLTVNVLNNLAYITEPGVPQVEIINTSSNTTLSTKITSLGGTPSHVAISPNGQFAFVTLSSSNALAIIDTITNSQITSPVTSPIDLSAGGCTDPQGIATVGTRIYIACSGSDSVDVLDSSTSYSQTALISTDSVEIPVSNPQGVAVRADGQRVYVTLSNVNANSLFVIDNTQSPPAALSAAETVLGSDGSSPAEIALAPNGAKTYAYIAKEAGSDANGGVDVVDVTSDAPSVIDSFPLPAGPPPAPIPDFIAATPDGSLVYITLQGTDQVEIFSNSSTVNQLASSPLGLASGAIPQGIAIPPLSSPPPSTGLLVYVLQQGLSSIALIDNLSPPALDTTTTPPPLTSAAGPVDIANIPVPQ